MLQEGERDLHIASAVHRSPLVDDGLCVDFALHELVFAMLKLQCLAESLELVAAVLPTNALARKVMTVLLRARQSDTQALATTKHTGSAQILRA